MTGSRTESKGRLSRLQRDALALIERARTLGHDPHGVCTTGETHVSSGEAWVHWQTAEALERRGLIRIDRYPGDGSDIYLTEAGRVR